MMRFLHLRDLLTEEQIKMINSPFYLQNLGKGSIEFDPFPKPGDPEFYKKRACFAIVSYFEGNKFMCQERIIPILAPFAGVYAPTLVYTWRNPNHGSHPFYNNVMFRPGIFDINPIVYFTADNALDWLNGEFAYREVTRDAKKDTLFISDEDLDKYLKDPEWLKKSNEVAVNFLQTRGRKPEEKLQQKYETKDLPF